MCGVCLAPFSIALTLAPCSHTCRSRIPFLNISCFIDSLTDGWMDSRCWGADCSQCIRRSLSYKSACPTCKVVGIVRALALLVRLHRANPP